MYFVSITLFLLSGLNLTAYSQIINSVSNIYKAMYLDQFIVYQLNDKFINMEKAEDYKPMEFLINSYLDEWTSIIEPKEKEINDVKLNQNFTLDFEINEHFWNLSSDPSIAFIIVRRLSIDWPKIKEFLHEIKQNDILEIIRSKEIDIGLIINEGFQWNLFPAAASINRVEGTYRIPNSCFTHQKRRTPIEDNSINNNEYKRILQSKDAVIIASKLLIERHFFWAFRWLKMAKHLLGEIVNTTFNISANNEQATSSAPTSVVKNKYLELLFNITKKQVKNAKEHELLSLLNKEENELISIENEKKCEIDLSVDKDWEQMQNNIQLDGMISVLCRQKDVRPDTLKADLKCYYDTRGSPWLILMPIKVEELSKVPEILYFHKIVSKKEINTITNFALPLMLPAEISEHGSEQDLRSSNYAWLRSASDKVVKNIELRLQHITGYNLDDEAAYAAEALQVNIYGAGGHYVPHHDYFNINDKKKTSDDPGAMVHRSGDRIATLMLYMTDDIVGGGTVFPILGISVIPVEGSVVFWKNLLPSGRPDQNTYHSACPVRQGVKIVANKWIKYEPQIFNAPCPLR